MRKWGGNLDVEAKSNLPESDPIPEEVLDEELTQLLRTALNGTGKNHKRPNAHKEIPLELLIVLRKKKIPMKAIARICKCSEQNVRRRLAGRLNTIRTVEEYKNNRADILAHHQKRILDSMTDRDIEGADLKDKAVSFGILYDKERLELGKGLGAGEIKVMVVNYADPPAIGQEK